MLFVQVSLILFETIGYGLAGAAYKYYNPDGEGEFGDRKGTIGAVEALLSPVGALNNIVRWHRNMITSFAVRAGLDFAIFPEETFRESLNWNMAKYSETVFDEGFLMILMLQTALDATFMFLGWAVYWII